MQERKQVKLQPERRIEIKCNVLKSGEAEYSGSFVEKMQKTLEETYFLFRVVDFLRMQSYRSWTKDSFLLWEKYRNSFVEKITSRGRESAMCSKKASFFTKKGERAFLWRNSSFCLEITYLKFFFYGETVKFSQCKKKYLFHEEIISSSQ